MLRCRIINLLLSIFPLKIWQDFLLQKHIQDCLACQEKLASREETQSLLIQESEIGNLEDLWPQVKVRLTREKRKERLFRLPRWGWAVGAVGLLAAVLIGIWLYRPFALDKSLEEELGGEFQIKYIRVDNKPARTYVFQPQDSNMIIIWAEKDI